MADFDLLVPEGDADRAVALLLADGWRVSEPLDPYGRDGRIDTAERPGVGFSRAGSECDLHWHMLHDCCWEGADADFWERAQGMEIRGRTFLAPDPTDLLFHVCVHGTTWNPLPPLRWIADAATVMRAAPGAIDWERLAEQAHERLLGLVVREALRRVSELTGTVIPEPARRRLQGLPVSPVERLEYRLRLVDLNYRRTVRGRWCQLTRQHRGDGLATRILRIPSFMQQIWAVPRKRALPGVIASHVLPAWFHRLTRRTAGGHRPLS